MADESTLIATVPKNGREELRVRLAEFRGETFVDLRLFAETGAPDRVPTKSGFDAWLVAHGNPPHAVVDRSKPAGARGAWYAVAPSRHLTGPEADSIIDALR